MNHPSQLFDRIRRQQAHRPSSPRDSRAPAPAPAQPTAAPAAPRDLSTPPHPDAPTPPAPATRRPTGHGLYSQVMRSHDRMGTRHL